MAGAEQAALGLQGINDAQPLQLEAPVLLPTHAFGLSRKRMRRAGRAHPR